jgi:hypothetical protein
VVVIGDKVVVKRFLSVVREKGRVRLLGLGVVGGSCKWLYKLVEILYLLQMIQSFVDSLGAMQLLNRAT